MNVEDAHLFSSRHRAQIEGSSVCGCFYCLATYPPWEITEWIHGGVTARCPRCGIDAVLGSSSGVPLTTEFLTEMMEHWF
jgi:hypothetical protein